MSVSESIVFWVWIQLCVASDRLQMFYLFLLFGLREKPVFTEKISVIIILQLIDIVPTAVIVYAWVGWSVLSVCLCDSVCPHSKRKTTWANNSELGTHNYALWKSSAYIDRKVETVQVTGLWSALAWVYMSVWLPGFLVIECCWCRRSATSGQLVANEQQHSELLVIRR